MLHHRQKDTDLVKPTTADPITRPSYLSTSSVTAIIPAYNEAGRIGKVLGVLRQVPHLNEIIVVDDGSSDATANEARQASLSDRRIRVIRHAVNRGKGQAIFTARQDTKSRYILLLDADLVGLTQDHVISLILPVIQGQADMTMGLFQGGYWRTDLAHWLTPWLTGQRCMIADLLLDISFAAAEGYGLETALTVAAKKYAWRVKRVPLRGAYHIPSESHRGLWTGLKTRTRMYAQVVRAWYIASGGERLSARLRDWMRTG